VRIDDPIGRDARKSRRDRRLGSNAACVVCGKQNPVALMRVNRSLLEEHHVAGRANDDLLVAIICRNCHAVLSEGQRDSSLELCHANERTSLEQLESVLLGLSDFFDQLGQSMRQRADELDQIISQLDHNHPDWRNLK
jgi:hypothetical protein